MRVKKHRMWIEYSNPIGAELEVNHTHVWEHKQIMPVCT